MAIVGWTCHTPSILRARLARTPPPSPLIEQRAEPVVAMAEQVLQSNDQLPARGIPCTFCLTDIPADSFDQVYWSASSRLRSAACPGCHQRTVLTAKLWRRWSKWPLPA